MLKRFFIAAALVGFVGLTSTGCGSSGTGTGGGAGGGSGGGTGGGAADPDLVCDAAPPATSFTKVYTDVFTPSCGGACHKAGAADGSGSYGEYDTQAKAFLQVGKRSLYAGSGATADLTLKVVDPKGLGTSTMWLKILNHPKSPTNKVIGGKMPLTGADLTAAQKQTVKDWICSGAAM